MKLDEFIDYAHNHGADLLTTAKDGKSYICPICGSGSGEHGSGITTKDGVHFTCWAGDCFKNADIIDVIGVKNNIPIDDTHFIERAKAAAQEFNIMIDGNNSTSQPPKSAAELERERQERKEKNAEIKAREAAAMDKRRLQLEDEFNSAQPATGGHPYLTEKRVANDGTLKIDRDGTLLIGLYDVSGEFKSYQRIFAATPPDGQRKKLAKGAGLKTGAFHIMGGQPLNDGDTVILAEGYATGASVYECIGDRYRVIIAFDAPNLPKVTEAIKSKFSNIKVGIAADDDAAKHVDGKNPGVEAAKKCYYHGALGYFTPPLSAFDRAAGLSDWNDYYCKYGADETREALLKAIENPIQPLSVVDTQIEAQGDIQTPNDFYGDDDNPQPSEAPVKDKEVAPEGVLTNELIEKYSTRLSRDIKIKDIEIIGGLFPRGKLSMIASAPGVGKSWATLYLACLLSKGRNIFDFDKIGTPVKTLVFCGEGGEEEPILRFKGTEWDNNSDNVILIDENNLLEENIDLLLTHEAGQRNVKRFIEYHRPAVVFIDSLIAFSDKDENSSKEMDGLLKFLTRTTKKYDIALVLSHHTRKRKMNERAAEQNLDEIIGTSSFARVIRQVIGLQPLTMEADNGGGDPNVPIVVRNLKSYRKKFKPFTFQLVENEHGKTDIVFDFEPKITGVNKFDTEAALYNYICETFKEEQEFSKRDLDSIELAYLGIKSDRTLQRMLNTLEKKGKLKSRGELKGMKYYLPQK